MNKEGVLHHKIKFNDRVYLVGDINELLDHKQNKLVAGPGVKIENDVISIAQLPKQETNCLHTCVLFDNAADNVLEFDKDHTWYKINVIDPTGTVPLTLAGVLTSDSLSPLTMVEVVLLVTMSSSLASVSFSARYPVTYVGDTNFSVSTPYQTMYIAIRSFNNNITISKLGVF